MDCYNCGATLNRKTRSAEHILPRSIGGKRIAYNLLCKSCNELFGRTIDQELASKLTRFYTLLHPEEAALPSAIVSGNRKDGKIALHEKFIAQVKKNRSFAGNKDYFRAIAKTCLNYYLSKGYPKQYCETIKAFIRNGTPDDIYQYYAPVTGSVHQLAENEVSHVLHIHGDKRSGLLYAYIELFNMQNLIFIFSMDYDDREIDITYCRDVITNEELTKEIKLPLTRQELEHLAASSAIMEEKLFPRFERLLRIIQHR
ncbi:HNH endonuclease [Pseudoflavitalea rhizosphaerae]|uniref:HNH endonuclease n=1 Tax=Pseudoflavitalea rhizosphaerae TaxID=1884793 RepID=UPI0013DFBB15|nr:HNH endonuclease [Pseudoflavitalea rhizosphaerae]